MSFRRLTAILWCLAGFLPCPGTNLSAQGASARPNRNPAIDKIVSEISPTAIEASIRTLVGFQTRHTLSATDDPHQGIGAARNWIKAEFERSSQQSGGRLQVEFDRYQQAPVPPRIFRPTEVINVVATLPGRLAEAKDRIYVVSGHYDSRSTGVNDTDTFAPGANDDASGTAAVLELARVLSQYEFDAPWFSWPSPRRNRGCRAHAIGRKMRRPRIAPSRG